LNLNWLALLLYADAFVSPSGTGTTYTATTARMIYAMERSDTVPSIRPCSSALRDSAACDVVQPGGVLHLSVLLSRLGKARRRDPVATIITYLVGPISVMVHRFHASTGRTPTAAQTPKIEHHGRQRDAS